jgi:hypothetical protein
MIYFLEHSIHLALKQTFFQYLLIGGVIIESADFNNYFFNRLILGSIAEGVVSNPWLFLFLG